MELGIPGPRKGRGRAGMKPFIAAGVLVLFAAVSATVHHLRDPQPAPDANQSASTSRISGVACPLRKVIDGDTIDVGFGSETDRVRFLVVNTPERAQWGYKKATEALRTILGSGNVTVRLESDGKPGEKLARGKYGRVLAYVFVGDTCANIELVRQGWSPYWTKYGASKRFDKEFKAAEGEAKKAKRGIWGKP